MSAPAQTIANHGQIDLMVLPPSWVEGKRRDNVVVNSSLRQFHPPNSPGTAISLFYRGRPVTAKTAQKFLETLKKPAHELTGDEIKDLSVILRNKSAPGDFEVRRASTNDLNGRRVLWVEGRYREIQEDTCAIYLDTDGSGRCVQEIFFQAPPDQYARHVREVMAAFRSIRWK